MPNAGTAGEGRAAFDVSNPQSWLAHEPQSRKLAFLKQSSGHVFSPFTLETTWCLCTGAGAPSFSKMLGLLLAVLACLSEPFWTVQGPDRLSRDPTVRMRDDSRYAAGNDGVF